MAASALEIIQTVSAELGSIAIPTQAVSNTDPGVQLLVKLLQACGDELVEQNDWKDLTYLYTFSTVPSQAAYPLPTDFNRLVPTTVFDRSNSVELYEGSAGTIEQAEFLPLTVFDTQYRVRRGNMEFTPTPTAVRNVKFEYISQNWVNGVIPSAPLTSGPKDKITQDGDTFFFSKRLLVSMLKFKWRQARQLDTTAAYADFASVYDVEAGKQTSAPVLFVGRQTPNHRADDLLWRWGRKR